MKEIILEKYEEAPPKWIYKILIVLFLLFVLAWASSAVSASQSSGKGLLVAGKIMEGIVTPDTKLLFNFTNTGVAYLLLETVCIAFLGTVVGAFLSLPLSFFAATNLMPRPLAFLGRILIMIIRTIPTLVYGLMFIRVTGPGAFAGLLTMSVSSIGMISKLFIESIENLDTKLLESLDAAGCTTFQKVRYGILPQLFADFMSTIIYRFDMNLRDATVLGLVGAGGIGAPLIFAMNAYRWHQVGAILAGLILLILVIEACSTRLRMKLVRG